MNGWEGQQEPGQPSGGFPGFVWLAAFLSLAIWVAERLGAFSLWRQVRMPDGTTVRFADGFASVDHPFHVVRAETLRRSLADGELLRWIGHHQGGYPVEFYPLGAAWLDVAGWTLALGSLPMAAVHKLVVIAIFLLPALGYALIAGFDRVSLGVALLATAGHICIRGWWWSGGSMELIEWGLVTNVASATALLIALPLAYAFVVDGRRRACAAAGLCCAIAMYSNPRSAIAIAALGAGIFFVALVEARERSRRAAAFRRLLTVGGLCALLAAPELISLARYEHLYFFVHYERYADLRAYWDSSVQAVGKPFFSLGLAGFALAWMPSSGRITRAVAATLAVYVAITVAVVEGVGPASLVDQLEATRLMPFQRLLWLYLAASGIATMVSSAVRVQSTRRHFVRDALLGTGAVAVAWLYVLRPPGFIPFQDRGLVGATSSAQPGIVELRAAVELADERATPGTALLVLGILRLPNAWHDQMWAPLWSDRPFFYDDWLWYWQTEHFGRYDARVEHAYPQDASTLEDEYLDRHGIGAVIITGEAKEAASTVPRLQLVVEGTWDVYLVANPTTVVTFDGANAAGLTIGNHTVSAHGGGSRIVIRRNWFPRWEAEIDGRPVTIEHLPDGYMAVDVPAHGASANLILRYRVDWIDWLARLAALAGVAVAIAMLLPARWLPRPRARLGRR